MVQVFEFGEDKFRKSTRSVGSREVKGGINRLQDENYGHFGRSVAF